MTTKIEVLDPKSKKYLTLGKIGPEDQPGSLSNIDDEGNSEIIIFQCSPDNTKTIISRSKKGVSQELGADRVVLPDPEEYETVRELTDGQSYEMNVKPRTSTFRRKIRFTHTTNK